MIFGANGDSGRAFTQTQSPQETIAALRVPCSDDFFTRHQVPTTVVDLLDRTAVENCLAQYLPDTIVSLVGGKNEQGVRSDATGNIHLIQAAQKYVPQARFILVTSMGCGEQWAATNEIFRQALGEAVLAKTEAENVLRQSSLNWTILRPCGLSSGKEPTYKFFLNNNLTTHNQYMNRAGLAAALAQIVGENNQHNECVYSVTAG